MAIDSRIDGALVTVTWSLAIDDQEQGNVMSSIVWDGDNLCQRVKNNVEELGHVKFDPHTKRVVLWLRDSRDVFGVGGGYIRGDEFSTMEDAKKDAVNSASLALMHRLWLAGLKTQGKDVSAAMDELEDNQPLTVSTFKEEMAKRDKKENRWKILGLAIAVAGIILALM